MLLWAVGILFVVLFLIFGGGIALLVTLLGSIAALISAPVLLFSGKRQLAGRASCRMGDLPHALCFGLDSAGVIALPSKASGSTAHGRRSVRRRRVLRGR